MTVPQLFTCISYVYNAEKRRCTVYPQEDMVDGKDYVIIRHQIAPRISAQWIVVEQNTMFRQGVLE